MTAFSRRGFLATTLAVTACAPSLSNGEAAEVFVCPPCGCLEDDTEFAAPGRCPDCDMTLMPKNESWLGFEPVGLAPRAGTFAMAGGFGRQAHRITVHYYLPDGFTPESEVLLVIPGAGRNSDDYRNTWLEAARQKNILVAALGYPEDGYDLAGYNLGGVVTNLSVSSIDTSTPGVIRARDEDIAFDVQPNREAWLFNDFDRVFAFLKAATGAMAESYDIFGHSAGGQILHRMALFHPASRANRLIAANAGWYTLPDLGAPLPTGLRGSPINESDLKRSFASDLTIMLGENDTGDGAGGTLLRTPIIDQQGAGRFSRGQHFFSFSEDKAAALSAEFRWSLRTVSDVGHDYREMSRAAANFLYQ